MCIYNVYRSMYPLLNKYMYIQDSISLSRIMWMISLEQISSIRKSNTKFCIKHFNDLDLPKKRWNRQQWIHTTVNIINTHWIFMIWPLFEKNYEKLIYLLYFFFNPIFFSHTCTFIYIWEGLNSVTKFFF
jgi:hypothetical protein